MSQYFSKDCLIRFAHCDPAGIVFHPNFFVLFNGLIEDWFREGMQLPWEDMAKSDVLIPVVNVGSDFYKPFHIGDRGRMCLHVKHIGTSSFSVEINFYKDDQLHVRCHETMVCIDKHDRRSRPIPDFLREKLQEYLIEEK